MAGSIASTAILPAVSALVAVGMLTAALLLAFSHFREENQPVMSGIRSVIHC
jgi:uncharacterized membrane protein